MLSFFFETCTSSIVGKSNRACMPASVASPFSRCPSPSPSPSKFPVQPPSGQLDRGHPARNRPDLGLNWEPKKNLKLQRKLRMCTVFWSAGFQLPMRIFATSPAQGCHATLLIPLGLVPDFLVGGRKVPLCFFFFNSQGTSKTATYPSSLQLRQDGGVYGF